MHNKSWFAAFIGLSATVSAQAQDFGAQAAAQSVSVPQGYANAAFQAPTGSGASFGSIGLGIYGQTTDIAGLEQDGSAGLNIGLGDPAAFLGLDVSASSSALFADSGSPESFGESGGMGFKVHRNLPDYCSVAFGVQSIGRWGGAAAANHSSRYVSWTKFSLVGGNGFTVTIGAGDQAYASQKDRVGAIGAVAFYFLPNVSLIAEYTGRFANAGLSVAPIKSLPLSLTAGAVNLTDKFDLGTQFGASLGYSFGFR